MKPVNNKSHVGMGYDLCPVCMKETNPTVLLDKMLRPILDRNNFTGFSMCDEHQKMKDDGYIACIEVKGNQQPRTLQEAERTGKVAHIAGPAWERVFNSVVPEKGICFLQEGVIDILEKNVGTNEK